MQTTLTHCSTKTSTFAPFVVEIYVYNSHFTYSCRPTTVARALTQLPYDNRHWTCKRLSPDSVFEILFEFEFLAAYSIRDSIRTEISDSQVPRLGLGPAERYPATLCTFYPAFVQEQQYSDVIDLVTIGSAPPDSSDAASTPHDGNLSSTGNVILIILFARVNRKNSESKAT